MYWVMCLEKIIQGFVIRGLQRNTESLKRDNNIKVVAIIVVLHNAPAFLEIYILFTAEA